MQDWHVKNLLNLGKLEKDLWNRQSTYRNTSTILNCLHRLVQSRSEIKQASLRTLPAMGAGVTNKLWEIGDIVALVEVEEAKADRTRGSYKKAERHCCQMKSIAAFVAASVTEIAGCFTFWGWLRLGYSAWWLIPGCALLVLFAYLLTLVDTESAGRAYAIYGGIYIAASLGWLWAVEGVRPDRWDTLGSVICIIGALVILYGPRTVSS